MNMTCKCGHLHNPDCEWYTLAQNTKLIERLDNLQAELDEVKSYTVDRDMEIATLQEKLEATRQAGRNLYKNTEALCRRYNVSPDNYIWEAFVEYDDKLQELGEVGNGTHRNTVRTVPQV